MSKSDLYATVRKEVEEVFGRSITTYGDCNLLCTEIYSKTGFTLNQNTLRRFFGLVKAKYPASSATLNILATYCGYHSPEEIALLKEKTSEISLQEEDWSVLFYLVNLFKALEVHKETDETFFTFLGHTIQFLQKKPELIDKFQRTVAKTTTGRKYYFEHFINIDNINSFFGSGLRYYLNEHKVPEGQLFGYALLCTRDWLVNEHKALKKDYEYIQLQNLSPVMPAFVHSRYFAAKLFYADIYEPGAERILVEAYNMHVIIKSAKGICYLYNCFEYALSFALVLTRYYEEALFYINYAFENYQHKEGHVSQGCYEHLLLLKAIALAKIERNKEAAELFAQLYPSQFYFTSKKLNTILYLLLASLLKKITQKQFLQFDELIKKTGFKKMYTLSESMFKV